MKKKDKNKFVIPENIKRPVIVLSITGALIVILLILLIISRSDVDYSDVKLRKNKNEIFTLSDLKLNDLKFLSSEKDIKKELGKPKKTEKINDSRYNYKIYNYKGLKLTLKENYSNYVLVGAEITNSKYKTSRDTKVGDSVSKVIKKYPVKNVTGNYMYGNYSIKALDDKEITKNIYLGARNKNRIIYINRDYVTDSSNTNIAKISYYYKNGKVKKITWSYDYK